LHCVNAITKSLLSLDGIKDVKVDLIKNQIEEQGYDII
jgi:copper chaperone CopZ